MSSYRKHDTGGITVGSASPVHQKRTNTFVRQWWLVCTLFVGVVLLAACGSEEGNNGEGEGEAVPDEIRLDYAHYSPTSLVLKEKGWVEEAFAEEGIEIEWVLSQGSNNALEFLNSASVDFGSSAGAAALVAKSNNNPIKNVYIYSQPEWTALVVPEGSEIKEVSDLSGKSVAATLGTDPFIFLLRALHEAGMSQDDIELVQLQHNDGASALINGDVDAWSGLDPHMARLEVEESTELFYRKPEFNTYGFLNVRKDFAAQYPQYVEKVIELYEQAREWTLENPAEARDILAEEAGLEVDVAELQMERNDFSHAIPGVEQRESLTAAGEILDSEGQLGPGSDVEELVEELIDPSFAERVIEEDQ